LSSIPRLVPQVEKYEEKTKGKRNTSSHLLYDTENFSKEYGEKMRRKFSEISTS